MPKANSHQVIARQWEMLNLIPKKTPGITARALADELERLGMEVSKRTVERDLDELSRSFGIACNDKGKPYGWYWMNGSGVNLPALTLADALSLRIVEQQLRPLLPSTMLDSLENRFKEAQQKLNALADSNSNAHWLNKVRHKSVNQQLLSPSLHEGVLETVQSALLEDKQIAATYKRTGEEKAYETILHPIGMVQGGPTTYLIATARDYENILLFAIHRIQKATQLTEDANRPKDFNIDEYIKGAELTFGSRKTIKLKAYVSEWLYNILIETPLSQDQTIELEGDWSHLTATVDDSWQLRWWILSQGDGIQVKQPKSLKKEIIKELKSALELYDDE